MESQFGARILRSLDAMDKKALWIAAIPGFSLGVGTVLIGGGSGAVLGTMAVGVAAVLGLTGKYMAVPERETTFQGPSGNPVTIREAQVLLEPWFGASFRRRVLITTVLLALSCLLGLLLGVFAPDDARPIIGGGH